jgi:hypothetical protein
VHPYAQNITGKFYRYLKHAFYWQADVNQIRVRNEDNTVRAKLTVEPLTHRFLNLTIRSPSETTKFTDIESKMPLPVPNSKTSFSSRFPTSNPFTRYLTGESRIYETPICKVSSRQLETFDGVKYRAPITTCYSVLAKDCGNSETSKFAVLMKKLSPESEEKKVKILTKLHRIEIEPTGPSSQELKVIINGQQVLTTSTSPSSYLNYNDKLERESSSTESSEFNDNSYETDSTTLYEVTEHKHVVVRIQKVGSYVKCVLPEAGVRVYFDGYSCNVKMSQLYKSSQCGLCGQYDMETSNEFETAGRKPSASLSHFFTSYLLTNDDECEMSETEQARIQSENEYYPQAWGTQSRWYSGENEMENSRESQTSQSQSQTDKSEWGERYVNSNENLYETNLNGEYRVSGAERSPIAKTKVIEHGHEICFSKSPVEQCPHHSYPTSYGREKTVVYSCMDRSDSQTQIMHQRTLRGQPIEELTSLPASFTKAESLPSACATF